MKQRSAVESCASNGLGQSPQIVSLEGCESLLPRQVVTLAYLSDHLPAGAISDQLAASLMNETGATVLLVRFTTSKPSAPGAPVLNGVFHMPPQLKRTDSGVHQLDLRLGPEPPTAPGIASLLRQLSRLFRHILVEVEVTETPPAWLFDFLLASELSYLLVRPANEDIYRLEQVVTEARRRGRVHGLGLKPVACLRNGEEIAGFDHLALRVATPLQWFIRDCPETQRAEGVVPLNAPGGQYGTDIRRLAREIGGRLLGLALSSGAAKGFAHIGVIQVLEEHGIEIDVVAGASMGAYVGSLWAHGCDGPELERLARELEGRWRLLSLVDPAFPPRQGFLRGFAVKRRLMRTLGEAHFADLVRPLRVVAANLETLERVVFSWGDVATAVHASIAVPGVCVPVQIDGEAYIDGGVVEPLPVNALRELGVTRVLAVDAIPTPERIRYGLQVERELARERNAKRRRWFRREGPLDQRINYFARGNLFEILMRSVHGAQIRVAETSGRRADLLLRPDICDDRWLDFRNPGKFIALGREAAERHIEEIKILASRKETNHVGESAQAPMAATV